MGYFRKSLFRISTNSDRVVNYTATWVIFIFEQWRMKTFSAETSIAVFFALIFLHSTYVLVDFWYRYFFSIISATENNILILNDCRLKHDRWQMLVCMPYNPSGTIDQYMYRLSCTKFLIIITSKFMLKILPY